MKTGTLIVYCNGNALKQALVKYIRRFDRCSFDTQQAHLSNILCFLSFIQERQLSRRHGLNFGEPFYLDWICHEAARIGILQLTRKMFDVDQFLLAIQMAGIIATNPLSRIKSQFGKQGWAGIARALKSENPQHALESLRPALTFTGDFGDQAKTYIDLFRSTSGRCRARQTVLINFNRFLDHKRIYSIKTITSEIIQEWMGAMTCGPKRQRDKVVILKNFFNHLTRLRVIPTNPVSALMVNRLPRRKTSFMPYIFSQTQIRTILNKAKRLSPTHAIRFRAQILHTIFCLLYTLGLRVGEVCRLKITDLDFRENTLFIREAKFFKERVIPFGPKLAKCLHRYIALRRTIIRLDGASAYLFLGQQNRPINAETIRRIFHDLIQATGIPSGPIGQVPRLHDLRHTFAVHRLWRWYKEGGDVQNKLVLLSTFMGHVDIYSTQVYLTITEDLLNEANTRFHKSFGTFFDKEQ